MKTKKKETSPSRFTRGEKVTAKGAKRHARKTGGVSRPGGESMPRRPEEAMTG